MANEIVENAGVVTEGGTIETVVIDGTTYTGIPYGTEKWRDAVPEHDVIAMQGGMTPAASNTINGPEIESGKTLVADGVVFSGCTTFRNGSLGTDAVSYGSALYNNLGTVSLFSVSVKDNWVNCNAQSSWFITVISTAYGGAIANNGIMNISGSTFRGNTATASITRGNANAWGGAIYNDSMSTARLTVEKSLFFGNMSTNGGAIANSGNATVTGCSFTGNVAVNDGGAITNNGSSALLSIVGGTLALNRGSYGGAVNNTERGQFSASGILFAGNTATGSGGAIANWVNSVVTVTGSTFSGNVAPSAKGGAVYNEGTMTLRDSVFATETDMICNNGGALTLGGTIWTAANIDSNNAITIEAGTKFVLDLSVYTADNTKEFLSNYDTAFFPDFENFSISLNVGQNQAAGKYILATGVSSFTQTISVYADGTSIGEISVNGSVDVNGAKFRLKLANGNLVFESSTAIVTKEGTATSATIGTTTYRGTAYAASNIASAMHDNDTVVLSGATYGNFGTVSSGKTLVAGGVLFKDGSATRGGAIYNNYGTATITGSTFTGNAAGSYGGAVYNNGMLSDERNTFIGNLATSGAAIHNTGGGTAMVTGSTFVANTAQNNGGAICNSDGKITLENNIFSGNKATHGGAFAAFAASTVSGSTFTGNSATYGGAIYSESSLWITQSVFAGNEGAYGVVEIYGGGATITQSVFSGNSVQDGSGVYNKRATLVSGCTFIGNTASNDGGAIDNTSSTANLTIQNSVFEKNCGSYGGAVNNTKQGQIFASNVLFAGNTATGSGGAIANWTNSTTTVTGSTFTGNTTLGAGGAIYNTGAATFRDSVFATETDMICNNGGTLTLGGTVWTAANITSTNAITVESDTKLVLDLSVCAGTTTKELLTNYDTMFGESQSNLSITVNVDQEQSSGVYTLATNAASFDCPITLDIDNEFVAPLDFVTKIVFGKRAYRLDWNNQDLQLVVEDVSDGKVFGGGTVSSDTVISEATGVKIIGGGSFIAAAGGVYAKNAVISVNAETGVTVEDGNFSNIVCAGSVVNENTKLTVNADSTLTITGGTFAKAVAGGSYIQKAGGAIYEDESGLAKTSVNITGGTFLRDIFGGNIAAQNALATKLNCYAGSAEVTIDALENAVFIGGNIVAGSSGHGMVYQTNVTFKGSDENLHFGKNSIVCGDSHDGTMSVSCIGKDARNLSFENFTGVLGAQIVGFDKASFSGGSVTLTKSSRLSEISVWSFSDGATLDFADDVDNDFWSDTLNIGSFDPETEWTVMTGGDLTLANWGKMNSVTIAGETATFQNGCWESSGYKFYREDNALKVAKLA